MNLKELNSFKLSDAVTFHDKLNPKLWNSTKLRPEVRDQLLKIAEDFLQELGVHDLDVKDITISGSNAAYSYTKYSDLDLHILVDMGNLPTNEVYRELFTAKKTIYNDTHDITIHKIPVELYVQDSREPVVSLGEYSVMNDEWIRIPTKRRSDFDQTATKSKYEKLLGLIEIALQSKKYSKVKHIIDTIKRYRQAGLDKGGEFGPENLAYKMLRSQGYITKLYELRDKLHSEKLSFETMYRNVTDEDYDPNGPPPGPEFKPTMPAGTVKVDVSDVYDWYKLGQHISNLKGLGKHDFGQGPPSTIMAFGDEDIEHKYIDALKKTGLTTTDIDPLDPKQPKGMPRQKVDPTYNVNEAFDQPYKLTWTKGDYGDTDAVAKLPDGTNLLIMFDKQQGDEGEEAVQVEFYRNNSQEVTSEGDAQKVFATVLTAIHEYVKKYKPLRLTFSASKDNWAKQQQNSESRAKLYDRLVQRYSRAWGYRAFRADRGDLVIYELSRIQKAVKEELEQMPSVLYHATYKQRLKSIKLNGLGAGGKRNWTDSKRGVVYLALDPHVAESYAETALDDLDADWDIVILQVSTNGLDPNKFHLDSNVQDNEGDTVEYHGIIPPSNISLYKSGVAEEYNTMQFAAEKTPVVSPYAGIKDNQYRGGISEASGYIPSEKEKNDPRFKTALSVDINPYTMKKGAKQFGWNISRAGIPPTAKPNGKI